MSIIVIACNLGIFVVELMVVENSRSFNPPEIYTKIIDGRALKVFRTICHFKDEFHQREM